MRLERQQRRRLLILAFVLAAAAFALSLLPLTAKNALHTTGGLHPLFHLVVFVTLGLLAVLAADGWRRRLPLLLGAVLLGLAIEYTEKVRFYGVLEMYDIVTDACGVLLGALGGWLLVRKKS